MRTGSAATAAAPTTVLAGEDTRAAAGPAPAARASTLDSCGLVLPAAGAGRRAVRVQPVSPPATLDEFRALLDRGALLDLAGRPLVVRPCAACGGTTTGEACPASVPCPLCRAHPGQRRCYRPSGHDTSDWHAERRAAAEVLDQERERAGDPTLPAPWPAREHPTGTPPAPDELALF